MRTRDQFIDEYAVSHRNFTNQIIHLVWVPLIFFATVGLLWAVKLDPASIGFEGPILNLALLAFAPILAFYARLGRESLITGLVWTLVSTGVVVLMEQSGLNVALVCGVIWGVAWVFQFIGHHIEKAKPSFGDDLVFLLIGPLFVQIKFGKIVQGRSLSVLRG